MSEQEKKELTKKLMIEALKKFRGLFNKSPDDDAIELYAEMLSAQYEFKQVTWALSEIVKKGNAFFPSCGEIFSILSPVSEPLQDKAPQIAAEMLQALRWYGPHDEVRMLENVSPEAKATFLRLGFTGDIRNSENIDTVRAQLERLARSVMTSVVAEKKNEKLESLGINTGKILQLKRPDFSNFLPGDPA